VADSNQLIERVSNSYQVSPWSGRVSGVPTIKGSGGTTTSRFLSSYGSTFDAGAVVPRPVEEAHLATGRQMTDVPLEEPLTLFSFRWHVERDHLGTTRIEVFEESLDRAALTSSVATFEHHHQLVTRRPDPVLRLEQLDLEIALRRLVFGS